MLVLVDDYFRNTLTIGTAFHQSLEDFQTELLTVENIDHFIDGVPSSGIPDLVCRNF